MGNIELLLVSGGVNLGDRELLLDDGDVLGGLLTLLLVGSAWREAYNESGYDLKTLEQTTHLAMLSNST